MKKIEPKQIELERLAEILALAELTIDAEFVALLEHIAYQDAEIAKRDAEIKSLREPPHVPTDMCGCWLCDQAGRRPGVG